MRFTGSRARLLAACQYGFRHDVAERSWPDSDEAKYGRALHWLSEMYIKQRMVLPASVAAKQFGIESEEHRLIKTWGHMQAWLARHPLAFQAEVKLAVDLRARTSRMLMESGPRDYSGAEPDEIPMTLDLVDISAGVLWDWKTGHSASGHWSQIATQALAVAWLTGLDVVRGGILHATEDGVDDSRVHPFDCFDVDAIADDLNRAVNAIGGSKPNPGDHCTELRCGAFGHCPATLQTVEDLAAIIPANELVRGEHKLSLTIESAEHAAWALHRLRTYEAYAKQVKAAIRTFVGDREHPLPGGNVLRETERHVERLDVSALKALARAKGATEQEIANCTYEHTESAGIKVTKARPAA